MKRRLAMRTIQVLAGCAITAGGLIVFFRDVNIERLVRELRGGSPLIYIGCGALTFLSLWLRALRWGLMLPQVAGCHRRKLFNWVVIGFMINNIVPARAGEAARIFLVWKKNGFSPAVAIGAFMLERSIDLFVFASFFFLPVLLRPNHPSFAPWRPFALLLLAGFVLFVLLLALISRFPLAIRALFTTLTGYLPPAAGRFVSGVTNDLFSNLDWLQSPGRVVGVALLSFATTLPFALQIQLLGIQAGGLDLIDSLFVQASAAFGAAIPLAPGYVGTLHAFMLQGLIAVGIEPDQARAIAILYHALSWIPVTAVGLYYFFRTDIRLRDMTGDPALRHT